MSTAVQRPNIKEHIGTRNLRPYQPGQSGNPLGRSIRKYSVVNKCKDLLAGVHTDKYTAERLALEFMKRIYSPKTTPTVFVQLVALLWQYTEQKPVQKVEVVTEPDAAELCHRAYKALYDGAIAQGLVIDEFTNNLILDGVEKIYPSAREVAPDLFASLGGDASGG